MAGYTRQSLATIINGADITAPPLNSEFNQILAAFNATTGHAHDGSTGSAPKINLTTSVSGYLPAAHGGIGGKNKFDATSAPATSNDAGEGYAPGSMWENTTNGRIYICVGNTSNAAVWRELVTVISDNQITPISTDSIDLGTPTIRFQDAYLSGGLSAVGNVSAGGNLIVTGTAAVTGDATFANLSATGTTTITSVDLNSGAIDNSAIGTTTPAAGTFTTLAANTSLTAATADINGGSIDNTTIGSSTPSTGSFTTLGASGTSTLATVDINAGNIDNTVIGASTAAAGSFTTISSTGNATLATADINGGSIDGAVIGANSAAAITGTTITGTSFVGPITGAVTGNTTGSHTGSVTGNVTGDLTGNVTAASGTSSFNNVTIDGTLNMNAGTSATIQNLTAPTNDLDAATKKYVDDEISTLIGDAGAGLNTLGELADALNDDDDFSTTVTNSIATKLPKAGGTMTGAIAMSTNKITGVGDPTSAQDVATKVYTDTQRDTRVAKTGDTMSGALAMGSNKITGLGTPTAGTDATTKTYVDNILGSATVAATSASNAATSESNAATSETNASNSATAAASSASSAAASLDSFDDRYLGAKSSAPTVDNDGDALIVGALYFDSTAGAMKVYSANGWTNAGSSVNGTTNRYSYTATAGQTVFAATYDAGYVDVFLNGVKQLVGTDVTATSGTSVVFASGTTVNDIVEIVGYGTFVLADHLTQTQSDARYVNLSGDTMTGGLNITVGDNSQLTLEGNDTNPTTIMMDYNSTGSTDRVRIQNNSGDLKFTTSNGQVRQTITKTGNVGIGTDLPTAPLTVDNTTNNQIRLRRTASGNNVLAATFSDTGSTGETYVAIGSDGDDLVMRSGGSEAMRIDSSGNLLVGQSTYSVNNGGIRLRQDGEANFSRSGQPTIFLNRVSSNGEIARFTKDGATVGVIGSRSSAIYIGRGDTGISFTDNDDAVYPVSPSGLAIRDAAIDLGISNVRFKDLYLSGTMMGGPRISMNNTNGGIYFGTTGTNGGGGFGDNGAIARAASTGYHTGGSQVGDLVIASERQTSLHLSTSSNSSGGVTTRMKIDQFGRVTTPYQPSVAGKGLHPRGSNASYVQTNSNLYFDTLHHNVGSHFNNSTGVFTCPVAGVYFVFASFLIDDDSGVSELCRIGWFKNGTEVIRGYDNMRSIETAGRYDGMLTASTVIQCSANDTLTVRATNGAIHSGGESHFNVHLLG
jgi:hypothetical protein